MDDENRNTSMGTPAYAVIDRVVGQVFRIAREVERALVVSVTPRQRDGDDTLDIDLTLDRAQCRLHLSTARLHAVDADPALLRRDIEDAVADMRREGAGDASSSEHGATRATAAGGRIDTGQTFIVASGSPRAGADGEVSAASTLASGFDAAAGRGHGGSPAVEASGAAHGDGAPLDLAPLRSNSDLASAHGDGDRDQPATGHAPRADSAEPPVDPEDRHALDHTSELARHMIAEMNPDATVAFEEYRWHGDLVLDILISLHGHEHHYEISAARAALMLRDHEPLHHDLEGVVRDLGREAMSARH